MLEQCRQIQDELVEIRRYLHTIPEVGEDLPATRKYVCDKLDKYGIPYILSERDSAVLAVVKGSKTGKTVALRADMDALPIREENRFDYSSANGNMHACGHDAHTAMLLGAAKVINENRNALSGEIRFLFQTSEEQSKGAEQIIENGWIDDVDMIFGTHIGTIMGADIPCGTVLACPGTVMASFDRFIIKIKGRGCHGSTPEKGVDPVNITAHLILALQAVGTRELAACDPNVITIGKIHGGSQYNIIPDEVVIEGTIRTLDEEIRGRIFRRIEEISAATAAVFGGSAEFILDKGASPVVNDEAMARLAAEAAAAVVGKDKVITSLKSPNMGGEDFACYLQKKPGAYLFLSSSNPEKQTNIPHHNARFNIDEDVLWVGSAIFTEIVSRILG